MILAECTIPSAGGLVLDAGFKFGLLFCSSVDILNYTFHLKNLYPKTDLVFLCCHLLAQYSH